MNPAIRRLGSDNVYDLRCFGPYEMGEDDVHEDRALTGEELMNLYNRMKAQNPTIRLSSNLWQNLIITPRHRKYQM